MSDSNTVLELQNARMRYAQGKVSTHALQGVDLTLKARKTFGLVGESGCGKSTLAHAIMGLLPRGAFFEHDGFFVFEKSAPPQGDPRWRPWRGPELAMIFQDPSGSLNPSLTIGQHLRETLKVHGIASGRESIEVAHHWLNKVRIRKPQTVMNQFPHELSGGMCQRICIALAICTHPKILVADEPTTALDVTTQKMILELLESFKQDLEMSILLVSHDLALISDVADDVGVMYAGRMVESGPTHEVLRRPAHPYTQALLRALPPLRKVLPQKLESLSGQPPRNIEVHRRCPFLDRCPSSIEDCQKDWPPLREIATDHHVLCHLEPQ